MGTLDGNLRYGEAIGRGVERRDVEEETGNDGEDVLAGREGMRG